MKTKKKKSIWKNVLCAVLVIAAVVGLGAGVSALSKRDTKTIGATAFTRGAVKTDTGTYTEDETAIFTKEAFSCYGLKVTPEFDTESEYQIFWYNEAETYISCTEVMTSTFAQNIPNAAKYARIVIYPSNLDKDGKVISDFKVNFWEIASYANDFKITVDRDQNQKGPDLFELAKLKTCSSDKTLTAISEDYNYYAGRYFNGAETFLEGALAYEENSVIVKLDCTNVSIYKLVFNERHEEHLVDVVFFDVDGKVLDVKSYTGSSGQSVLIDVLHQDTVKYLAFNIKSAENPVEIYEYLPR